MNILSFSWFLDIKEMEDFFGVDYVCIVEGRKKFFIKFKFCYFLIVLFYYNWVFKIDFVCFFLICFWNSCNWSVNYKYKLFCEFLVIVF